MASNDEAKAPAVQPFVVGALAFVAAFVVCTVAWRFVDRLVAPSMVRGALRFTVLLIGIAIIGTLRRQLTAKRGTASLPSI